MKWAHGMLALGVSAGIACGGEGGEAPPSQAPGAPPAASASSAAGPGSAAPPTSPSTATNTAHATARVEMRAPVPSTLGADLQALAIDPQNLPLMENLDPRALRGVMKLLARSLGARCGDCHAEGDFAAPTRRKKIAARMWDQFAVQLTTVDGSPVFCDSCHQGRVIQLDRTDKTALARWMDASFVDGLKRKDGKAEECESCHVDMEMHFLVLWGR
jgi:Cytochrome c7 and related cytochrome c